MNKGLFITFEGIDGCGKTTQLNMLNKYLQDKGYETVLTKEPGGKGLGEKIRNILLNYDGEVSDRCESFLFLADRAQNIDLIVNPAIRQGKIVLCDRHTDSTLAYQGYGRELDLAQIKKLNDLATNGRKPDITFIFDVSLETSSKRVGKDKDRMEKSGKDFFQRVRNGYLKIAQNEPQRVKVINSEKSIDEVFAQVLKYINEII
ncbi:MAG: dTMP kinase [Cyanobacteriota bacterium]|nr:dTMP kinase [Cyanobacteriota bacterium]MDY6358070.1 dTMP kinase [Cyanobacteriota bacterium]MDY6364726.1 dTMP kinase [Cyanobacteriota bacterium]MDY6383096.1 dTMP kinase [Cyanobacteriota bacterium]